MRPSSNRYEGQGQQPLQWWRPEIFAKRRDFLSKRGEITRGLRRWFLDQGFEEVETPALQVMPGAEPHLFAFATTLTTPGGDSSPRYLHTSPEFAMKKLLVAGMPKIFQLAKTFRNADRSATHHPEFTMLEWYRADQGYEALIEDSIALIRACATACGAEALSWGGTRADPFAPWRIVTVADAFQEWADIDLMATIPDGRTGDAALLGQAARRSGIEPHDGDDWETIFFRVFLDRIEPELGHPTPTVLKDYPISMAALARPKKEDPRLAERFEIFVAGLELANAFGELTDAAEQRRRLIEDMARKRALYGQDWPIDEDFLAALRHGMPPSAGIALGFDRLVMLLTGADDIEDVLWAPVA
jgi:lysyl-tRNA synthetase class 2